jgi:hypothetical protein
MLSWQYRRLIIVVILILQIFSSQLNIKFIDFAGLNVFRIVLFVMAIFLFVRNGFGTMINAAQMAVGTCLALTLLMVVSLGWSEDIESGLRQISYVVTLMSMIYTLSFLVWSEQEFKSACNILMFLGMGIALIAYYEITTGTHWFESSIQQIAYFDNSLAYITDNLAWFTFDNPNDLSVHLVLCSIFGAMAFRSSAFPYLGYLMAGWIALLLDARLVLAVLAAYALMFLVSIILLGPRRFYTSLVSYAAIGMSVIFLALQLVSNLEAVDVSIFIRSELIWSAFEFARSTYFFGIGAGAFESEMWHSGFVGLTYGIVNPHNAFARMLAELGVLGFAAFTFLVVGPIFYIWRARLVAVVPRILVLVAIVLPLLFSIGSDPLASSSLQLGIALLWVGASTCLKHHAGAITEPARRSPIHFALGRP